MTWDLDRLIAQFGPFVPRTEVLGVEVGLEHGQLSQRDEATARSIAIEWAAKTFDHEGARQPQMIEVGKALRKAGLHNPAAAHVAAEAFVDFCRDTASDGTSDKPSFDRVLDAILWAYSEGFKVEAQLRKITPIKEIDLTSYFVNAKTIAARRPKPLEWQIENILGVSDRGVLGGPPGHLKTVVLTYMAIAVATGTNFLIWPTKQGRVLYVDGEMGQDDLVSRFLQQNDGVLPPNLELLPYDALFETGQSVLLDNAEWSDKIIGTMQAAIERDEPFALVILDNFETLTACAGDFAKQEVAVSLVNQLTRRLKAVGTASMVGDHMGKSEDRGIKGSNSKIVQVQSEIWCVKQNEEGNRATVELSFHKMRRGRPDDLLLDFEFHKDEGGNLERITWKLAEDGFENNSDRLVLLAIGDAETNNLKIAERCKCSEGTVRNARKRLIKDGYVDKLGEGLTPKGKKAVEAIKARLPGGKFYRP